MLLIRKKRKRGEPPIMLDPIHKGKPRRRVIERAGSWHNLPALSLGCNNPVSRFLDSLLMSNPGRRDLVEVFR